MDSAKLELVSAAIEAGDADSLILAELPVRLRGKIGERLVKNIYISSADFDTARRYPLLRLLPDRWWKLVVSNA